MQGECECPEALTLQVTNQPKADWHPQGLGDDRPMSENSHPSHSIPCLEYAEHWRHLAQPVYTTGIGDWELGIPLPANSVLLPPLPLSIYIACVRSHRSNPNKIQDKSQESHTHIRPRFLIWRRLQISAC